MDLLCREKADRREFILNFLLCLSRSKPYLPFDIKSLILEIFFENEIFVYVVENNRFDYVAQMCYGDIFFRSFKYQPREGDVLRKVRPGQIAWVETESSGDGFSTYCEATVLYRGEKFVGTSNEDTDSSYFVWPYSYKEIIKEELPIEDRCNYDLTQLESSDESSDESDDESSDESDDESSDEPPFSRVTSVSWVLPCLCLPIPNFLHFYR